MRFDAMLPYVLPSVPGCPDDMAIRALRLAAIEFFDKSGTWSETLPDITTVADTATYALPLPDGAEIARLLEVSVDGEEVDALLERQEAERLKRADSDDSFAWLTTLRDIALWPVPAADLIVVVEAVIKPSLEATEIPDEYAAHYLEGIASGALARLLKTPRQPWTSLNDAAISRAEFDRAVTAAAGMAGVGHVQGRLRVRPA